jgi:hypothetical protein
MILSLIFVDYRLKPRVIPGIIVDFEISAISLGLKYNRSYKSYNNTNIDPSQQKGGSERTVEAS